MPISKVSRLLVENKTFESSYLEREVLIDFYLPVNIENPADLNLLLINDGQNMEELGLEEMLDELYQSHSIRPLLCVGIHAGPDRKMEYGTASRVDYKGRGVRAEDYSRFIFEELIPFIKEKYHIAQFREQSFAGFSLGGLSALDIVWAHPGEFTKAGIFSGSLWWRTRGLNDGYMEATDRIMHQLIREGVYSPGLKFFFETGTMDETMDRNHNGIIDSIDDTTSLIEELEKKGYIMGKDIVYLELQDGKHDVATWARAMPKFFKWGWGTGE